MNTKIQGEMTEGMVMARLLKLGEIVLMPFGDNQRYDLALDRGGKLVRIQCKTGRLEDGTIFFKTTSSYYHRGRKSNGYIGQADIFGVYCPANEQVYFVPVAETGTGGCRLRLEPSKNKRTTGV